jgi:hypothetical protein
MAFGDSWTLLDDFNRANTNLNSGNWAQAQADDNPMRIVSNQVEGQGAGYNGSIWDNDLGSPDQEVAIDIVVKPSQGDYIALYLRCSDPSSSQTGYFVSMVTQGGTDTVSVDRFTGFSFTGIGADYSQEFSAGDKLGASIVGTTISVYRHNGTSWSLLFTRTDSTYSTGNYIGISNEDGTGEYDNFYGGAISEGGIEVLRRRISEG